MKRHTLTIHIDFDEILNYVYAQSAWHGAHNENVRILTPDNRNMLLIKLKEAKTPKGVTPQPYYANNGVSGRPKNQATQMPEVKIAQPNKPKIVQAENKTRKSAFRTVIAN